MKIKTLKKNKMEKIIKSYLELIEEEFNYFKALQSQELPTEKAERSIKKTVNEFAEYLNENL